MTTAAHRNFLWVLLLILFSRLPFVNTGYGGEEDAWAMRLVTERIATTGQYEVSRFPGHPLQELVYSVIWNRGAVAYNTLTVFLSTAGIAFFMLALRKLQIKNYLWCGIALAFVPAIYINSTNALDYTWAFAFLMMSLYFLVCSNYWVAGFFIGLAVGCRITSGAMLIPFCYLALHQSRGHGERSRIHARGEINNQVLKNIFKLISATILTSLILFIPVINAYGLNFFQYYEHFPIPAFAKNFYKGTFAVWGLIGFVSVIIAVLFSLRKSNLKNDNSHHRKIIYTCLIAILIYCIAFIRLPLKSAFMIPLVPFVILLFAILLTEKNMKRFSITMIVSSFFLGINLSDPYRAAAASPLSYQTTISGQQVSFDLLHGPVIADYLKRKQQMFYADDVIQKASTFKNKTVVIAGWWMANILVQQQKNRNPVVIYRHYLSESELKFYHDNDYKIFYLPKQDQYNDLRFGGNFTEQYAELLSI